MGPKIVVAFLLIAFVICVHSACPNQNFVKRHVSREPPSVEKAKLKAKNANNRRGRRSDTHDVFFVGSNVTYRENGDECEMQSPGAVQYRCTQKQGNVGWDCRVMREGRKWCPYHDLATGHYRQ